MITKERLQELIEQGATVYTASNSYKLSPDWYISYSTFSKRVSLQNSSFRLDIECIYEHKADAEWELEFGKGRVTRTESLDFMTYEEIFNLLNNNKNRTEKSRQDSFVMYNFTKLHGDEYKQAYRYFLEIDAYPAYRDLKTSKVTDAIMSFKYTNDDSDWGLDREILFNKNFNKENYTEACRLIKKLFMGEE